MAYPERNISEPYSQGKFELSKKLQGLIPLCIAGDKTAQKEIYHIYAPSILGLIKRYVFSPEAAAEILNDSFLKILTKMHTYSFNGPLEGWMHKIAVHTITDHLRKYIKHEQTVRPGVEEHDICLDEDITSRVNWKSLLAMIHSLPEVQRGVFNLYVFEDCSHREIAELLGISENNSRWHLNAARKKLKEKISLSM